MNPLRFRHIIAPILFATSFILLPAPSARATDEMSVLRLGVDLETIEKLLKEGEVLIIKESGPGERFKYVSAGVLINAPPEKVWDIITDYERYPEFVPDCEKAEVEPGDAENTVHTKFTVAVKFSILKFRVWYTLRQVHQKSRWRIDWNLKEGELAQNVGAWELIPLEEGKLTAAFYSLYSDLRSVGFLVKWLFKEQPVMELAITSTTAILMARAMKARAEGKALK